MSDVTKSVDVNVPVSTAYKQWTRFESFPQFMAGVDSVTRTDELHSHWMTSAGGAHREFDAEITEQHPDERIAWKSISGDARHAGVVTFHRLAAGQTRVTVQLIWKPQSLMERVGSLLNLDGHQVTADTERFKKLIERQGSAPGEYRGGQTAPVARSTAQGGDIVEVLRGQHEAVKRAFTKLQNTTWEARQQTFGTLADLLHTHETGERQVVHPVIRQAAAGSRQIADDRLAEEQRTDRALAELKALGVDHPAFDTKLGALRLAVLAHADAEEKQEFPLLAQLPPQRRQEMAEQLRAVQHTPIPR